MGDAPWQQRQWPPAQIVGDDFEKDMTAFYDQMDLMGSQLSVAFARMLGLVRKEHLFMEASVNAGTVHDNLRASSENEPTSSVNGCALNSTVLATGQEADHFQKLRTTKSLSLLQFSYYPPQKEVISKDTFGAQTDGVNFLSRARSTEPEPRRGMVHYDDFC